MMRLTVQRNPREEGAQGLRRTIIDDAARVRQVCSSHQSGATKGQGVSAANVQRSQRDGGAQGPGWTIRDDAAGVRQFRSRPSAALVQWKLRDSETLRETEN